jgi:hypothetical protein
VFHVDNDNRVVAIHRWLPGIGREVVVVASLNENTFYDHSYRLGFLAEAIGMNYSIATSMTSGLIPTHKAISAVSRLTDLNGTVCRPLRESRCRQTVC